MNPGHLSVLQFSRLLASATRAPRHFQLLHRVPPAGVEPATRRLKVGCSNQLSYRGLSSPGPLARAHAQDAIGGTVRAAVCEGIQRPACLHYRPRSPLTRPASHVRLARQARQQTRVQAVQPRVTEDDNALWAVQDLHLRPSARDAEALLPELTVQKPSPSGLGYHSPDLHSIN